MKIHISDLVQGDCLLYDVFNQHGTYILARNTVLNDASIEKLESVGVNYVDIVPRFKGSADVNFARNDERDHTQSLPEQLIHEYLETVSVIKNIFDHVEKTGEVDESIVEDTLQPLIRQFKQENDVVKLLLSLHSQDDYTYQHSSQVGMISYFLAKWLDMSEEEAFLVGKAGYLHDIGKSKINKTILQKPGRLTDDEYEEIKKHPQYGYEILQKQMLQGVVATVAIQHHERVDGSGYPYGLTREQIHPYTRIVAIADVYSAMISVRTYQEPKDQLQVLRELDELSYHKLDPVMTQTFIRKMIMNFIGKRVILTNGQSGTIIMTNPSDFFRPLVQVEEQFIDLSIARDLQIVRVNN